MEKDFSNPFELYPIRGVPGVIKDATIEEDDKTKFLQKLLRGEISAVEAYDRVIELKEMRLYQTTFSQIKAEHQQSILKLKQIILGKGELPDEESGIWGQFVKTLIAGSALISEDIILRALIEGEEHGLKEYHQFLDMDITSTEADLIRMNFIPTQERHIYLLQGLED